MLKMSKFQWKITHHTKNHEDFNLNEKRESIDANTQMKGKLGLPKTVKQPSL